MNNESFLIEELDLDIARNICNLINDSSLRNRAVANAAAAALAKKYFQDCEVDTETGLYNIYQVLEDIEISDVYIKDNYIDVRLYFDENGLFIPKSHFDNKLLPAAYMFIKVDSELSNGLVTGFILPSSVDTSQEYNGYYKVEENELISFYDVESSLIQKEDDSLPENFESNIYDYLDGKLTEKTDFYNILVESKEARLKLRNAAKAKTVFNFISVPKDEIINESPVNDDLEVSEETGLLETAENGDIENIELETPSIDFENVQIDELDESEDTSALSLESEDTVLISEEVEELPEIGLTETLDEEVSFELEETENLPEFSAEENLVSAEFDVSEISMKDYQEPETFEENIETENSFEPDFSDTIKMLDYSAYDEQQIEEEVETDSDIIQEEPILEVEEEPFSLQIENEVEIQEEEAEITQEEEFEEISSQVLDIAEETEPEIESEIIEEELNEEISEPSFEYSTNITPSIESFEENSISNLTEEMLETEAPIENSVEEPVNNEDIDALFNSDEVSEHNDENRLPQKKQKNVLLPVLGTIAILAGIGYYGYTKFFNNSVPDSNENMDAAPAIKSDVNIEKDSITDAMPVETVENVDLKLSASENNSVSIPAIERNLGASIAVSNLSIQISVPSGYRANKTAARYWTKMGKILQLNLKTELLLLTKQPITNKIEVELEFNKNTQKFDVKGIKASSGEKSIDDLILQTVKNALNINLNMNMSSFGNISGNPILIINL